MHDGRPALRGVKGRCFSIFLEPMKTTIYGREFSFWEPKTKYLVFRGRDNFLHPIEIALVEKVEGSANGSSPSTRSRSFLFKQWVWQCQWTKIMIWNRIRNACLKIPKIDPIHWMKMKRPTAVRVATVKSKWSLSDSSSVFGIRIVNP